MNEKGFGNILFIILALVFLGGVGFFLYKQYFMEKPMDSMTEEITMKQEESIEYETLVEDNTTPKEIDNETLEELDSLMDELDALETEDLSDLEL